mmetsp:Transcript_30593/g.86518  ORF Transcript_30593/g.86518 Transcript_30593/m.86518 type:complete len:213 (-) Transcript_30593:569-1207(-)
MAVGFSQELFVQLLHLRVLVRLADRGVLFVNGVHASLPESTNLLVFGARLPGATDAPSRACHDLDEMVRRHAVLHLLDQALGIPKAVSNGHADLNGLLLTVPIREDATRLWLEENGSLLHSIKPTNIIDLKACHLFSSHNFIHGTEGGLHHTPCGSKQLGCSGSSAQQLVVLIVHHFIEVNTLVSEELSCLDSCQHVVNIPTLLQSLVLIPL